MPHADRRLSIHLLPADPDASADLAIELLDQLRRGGWITEFAPGPRPLVEGGFARLRVESHAAPQFISNWQGGFRVACPVTGEGVVPAFSLALSAWRSGGARVLTCPCGRAHDLAALRYAPEAGFARGWLTVSDVAAADIDPDALAEANRIYGGLRIVLRRG